MKRLEQKELYLDTLQSYRVNYCEYLPNNWGGSRTVLLVHGIGSYHCTYNALLPLLAEENYRCIALDLPNHGFSEDLAIESIHLDQFTKVLLAFIEQLQLERIFLVGHSAGSCLLLHAQDALLQARIDIEQLFLLSPIGIQRISERNKKIIAALYKPAFANRISSKSSFLRYFHEYKEAFEIHWEPIEAIVSADRDRYFNATSAWINSIIHDYQPPTLLHFPTTVVIGRSDILVPNKMFKENSSPAALMEDFNFEQVEWHWLESCGHLPQIEKANQIMNLIKATTYEYQYTKYL